MRSPQRLALVVGLALVASPGVRWTLFAQVLPNPYRIVEGYDAMASASTAILAVASRSAGF